jgi:hypothetical protein
MVSRNVRIVRPRQHSCTSSLPSTSWKENIFLKSLLLGAASAPVLLSACGKDTVSPTASTSGTTGTTGTSSGSCIVAPTETEGPFPTKTPASYVRSNITDGKPVTR